MEYLVLNLLPLGIAIWRGHNDVWAIFATLVLADAGALVSVPLMLFGVGFVTFAVCAVWWFGCLIWALTGNTRARDMHVSKYHADAVPRIREGIEAGPCK
jgi:hypothetical protein